ncbi:MAG TPA: hypothetical protein VKS20_06310 [Candidatus Acidoferrales bacterium]|nr:hypothetical protein [Candidatus Acidoferrales bacterium]
MYESQTVAASGKKHLIQLTRLAEWVQDSRIMSSIDVDKRRSSRIFQRLNVQVRGVDSDGRRFRESCQTIVVNAHGGLIYLNESVELGGQVQITNPVTDEEQECRVVYLGDVSDKGQRVGLEFLSPSPHFWGMEFADPDVPRRSPPGSARKSPPR